MVRFHIKIMETQKKIRAQITENVSFQEERFIEDKLYLDT